MPNTTMNQQSHDADTTPAEAENTDALPAVERDDGAAPSADTGGDRLVPVSEAIRYRKRAQAAEQQLEGLQQRLHDSKSQLDAAQQQLSRLEQRQQLDALLIDAEAIDLDVSRLLVEQALDDGQEKDPAAAVEKLQRSKPYLFRSGADITAGAMPARGNRGRDVPHLVNDAAQRAAETGHRRDLLRYLRLRRGA